MRLIDADVLLDSIFKSCNTTEAIINNAPTIDAVPVVRGEWMPTDMGGGETDEAYVCSVCGEPWTLIDGTPRENNMHYCPNCGAKMESEGE